MQVVAVVVALTVVALVELAELVELVEFGAEPMQPLVEQPLLSVAQPHTSHLVDLAGAIKADPVAFEIQAS